MTGIERLRKLSEDMLSTSLWVRLAIGTEKDWDCCQGDGRTMNDELLSIADQIEREHAEDCFRMVKRAAEGKVGPKTQHKMALSLLEDWEREAVERERDRRLGIAADASMSAYDLLPADEREAIAWVREHGGLDAVKRRWECLSHYADPVPRSCMERRLARLQRQIDESHAALRRRNQRIGFLVSELNRAHNENREMFMRRAGDYTTFADEVCKRLASELRYVEGCSKDVMDAALNALDRRLMPEGCEWPRYEDGEPVRVRDKIEDIEVRSIVFNEGGILLSDCTSVPGWGTWRSYKERVKRPAVLAGDGKPLEAGQTVWDANGDELVIVALEDGGRTVTCRYADVGDGIPTHGMWSPSDLTHERPDSWKRIEEDALNFVEDNAVIPHDQDQMERDMLTILRRCKALAERERSES